MAALAVLLPLVPALGVESQDEAEKLGRELVRLRVETARAETAWRTERELLASTVAALKERAQLAEEKLDLTKARTAQEREDFDALRAKTETARDDLKTLEARLAALAGKLVAFRPSLPPRLSEALEMSYRSLTDAARPSAERMRQAMNILNRCAQFNRLVVTGEDVLTLSGESSAKSLTVIYWGLSHGYAIDRASHRAWLGSPRAGEWRWEQRDETFDAAAKLIAIAADQADPMFVPILATGPDAGAETAGQKP